MKFLYIFSFLFLTIIMAESDSNSQSESIQEEVDFLTRVVSDLASNGQQYLQYFRTGDQPINLGLLRTAQQITQSGGALGDSYTTLAADLAFMSDLSAMITPLPWFSARLADNSNTDNNNSNNNNNNNNGSITRTNTNTNTNTASTASTATNEVGKIGGIYVVGLSMIGSILLAIL